MSTPKLSDTTSIFVGESLKIEDTSHLLNHGETEPNTENISDKVNAHNDVDSTIDLAYNCWSQSTESVEHERRDASNSEGTELYPKPACSTPDAADDGKCMSCSSSSQKGRVSYTQVWTCTSSQQKQRAADAGLSSDGTVFFPVQRDHIKSDDSSSPPLHSPFDDDDAAVFCPPVPKKRSYPQVSTTTDRPTNASQLSSDLVPSRTAPSPPYHDSKHKMQTRISERKANDENVLDEMTVASSSSLDMPAMTASDSKLNLLVSRGMVSPQTLGSEEEQMLTMSFQSSSGEISPLPVFDASSRPQPKPRQPAVANDHVSSPPLVQKRLAPLVMPTAVQKPSTSTSTTVPSPLDRVIAVGGVNILGMSSKGAALNTSKTNVSSATSGPLMSPSSRTPPAPPPKSRKPSNVTYSSAVDGDTTDDDLDSADIKDSKF